LTPYIRPVFTDSRQPEELGDVPRSPRGSHEEVNDVTRKFEELVPVEFGLNAAKTRNPLKFAGVPQTRQQISAVSMPKFTILSGHVEEVLLFSLTSFSDCRYMLLFRRYSPTKLCDGAKMAIFCILYFQRDACRAFQTCILNAH